MQIRVAGNGLTAFAEAPTPAYGQRVCQKERHTLFFVPRHNEMKVVLTLTSYNGNVF
jgi:hypothetical protein